MASKRNRIGTCLLLRHLLVGLAAAGLWAGTAHAQGTNGQFPDPVTTRDLDVIASRLSLSAQQRQAIAMAHGEYRLAFAALREGEIEQYLQDQSQRGGRGRFNMNLDRDQIEKDARAYKKIMARIEQLDEQFFNQMQPVLTEQQMEVLPRVRMARARDRYDTGPTRFARFVNPGSRIDLSELYRDLDLAPEDHETIDPLVAQYERDLTAAFRTFHSDAREQQENMVRRLEAEGITEATMQDRRAARQAMRAFRRVWEESNRELSEKSQEIHDLNKRTYSSLVQLLPAEAARTFRNSYINRVYGEAAPVIGRAERAIRKALGIEELPDELRTDVEDLLTATISEIDRHTDGMVKLIEEQRETQSQFTFDRDARREFEENLGQLRETREKSNEQAVQTLYALLGEQYAQQVQDPSAAAEGEEGAGQVQATFIALDDGGGMYTVMLEGAQIDLVDDQEGLHVDPYIPGPISGRDVHRYAELLAVSEEMRPVLDALHSDYQEQFKLIENAEIKQVHDIRENLWQFDQETRETTPPEEDEIERLYRLRRRALDTIRALDGAFFDDVELAFGTEENSAMMMRIRLDRERQMYNRGRGSGELSLPGGGVGLNRIMARGRGGRGNFSFSFAGGPSSETSIDLAEIVSRLDLDETQQTAIDGILATYEQSAAATFRKAFEAGMAAQEAQDKAIAENMQQRGGRGRREVRMLGGRLSDNEHQQAMARAQGEMADLNRQTLADLMTRLDPEAAQSLEDAYNRQAFPEAFMDRRDVQAKLNAAMNMDDLTARQQQDLLDLSFAHRAEYDDFTDQMIEVIKATETEGENRFQGFQQRMQSMERLRFMRNDLNDRTVAHMRTILTEEQMERISAADEPAQQMIEPGTIPAPAIQIRRD